MPPRRCCCDEFCFTHYEGWCRGNNIDVPTRLPPPVGCDCVDDVEELADAWHPCSDWDDWAVTYDEPSGLCHLSNPGGGDILVHKFSEHPKYGRFAIQAIPIAGAVYEVILKKGEMPDEYCAGGEPIIFELTYDIVPAGDAPIDATLRFINGGTVEVTWVLKLYRTNGYEGYWEFCVDDEWIDVSSAGLGAVGIVSRTPPLTNLNSLRTFGVCADVAGDFFAIRGSSSAKWGRMAYKDHKKNNPICPGCSVGCCWPNLDLQYSAMKVRLKGVQSGNGYNCDATVEDIFIPFATSDRYVCECQNGGTVIVPGPGGFPIQVSISVACNKVTGDLGLSGQVIVLDEIGQEYNYGFPSFPAPNHPLDVEGAESNFVDTGQEQECIYEYSQLEIVKVYLIEGCCRPEDLDDEEE